MSRKGSRTTRSVAVPTLLREARKAKGLTLRDMAEVIGITYSHICRIENGARRVPLDYVDTWCAALGLDRLEIRVALLQEDLGVAEQRDLALAVLRRFSDVAAAEGIKPADARLDLLLDLLAPAERHQLAKRLMAV